MQLVETNKPLFQSLCEMNEGSRYIQTELEYSLNSCKHSKEQQKRILDSFYEKLRSFAANLCTQLYGNYVINKYLTLCQQCGVIALLLKFMDDIVYKNLETLMNNQYSCRIVQNILNSENYGFTKYSLKMLITKLGKDSNLMDQISKNQNGNHIVQLIIEKSCFFKQADKIGFIEEYITKNVPKLAAHQYACRVVQSAIKCVDIHKSIIEQMFS